MIIPAIVATGILLLVLSFYTDRVYWVAAIVAFAFHLIIGLLILPQLPYGWDIGNYHTPAILLIEEGVWPESSKRVAAFAAFPAMLYYVFGTEFAEEVFMIFNSLLAVLVPIPACYVTKKLYPTVIESPRFVMLVILFFPAPLLFMTLPMREAVSVFLFFLALALIVAVFIERQIWPLTLSLPVWGMLYLIRPELSLLLLFGSAAAVIVHLSNVVVSRSIPFSALVLVLSPIGLAGFSTFSNFFPLEALEAQRDWRAQDGAAYLEGMTYTSWWDVLFTAPTRAIYFQYAPFPLHVESLFHFFGLTALPILILLTVAGYRSLLQCRTDQRVMALLLTVYVGGIVGYGLVDSNFGTTIRHRIPFEYLLVVFAAPVLERWRRDLVHLLSQRFGQWPKNQTKHHKRHSEANKLSQSVLVGLERPPDTPSNDE